MLDTAGCNSASRPSSPSSEAAHPPQALNTGGVEPLYVCSFEGDEPNDPVTLAEIFEANEQPTEFTADDLTSLAIGESFIGGGGAAPVYSITRVDPITAKLQATAALLSPFAITWTHRVSLDHVRVDFRDEQGLHTAHVDFTGGDPEIYGVSRGIHGIEGSYELGLTGERWHTILDAAEIVRDGGIWGGTSQEGAALDAINAAIVVDVLGTVG